MKRRREPPPSPQSPWRWAIGGPITDFGDSGIEAGPSSAPVYDHADNPSPLNACCVECAAGSGAGEVAVAAHFAPYQSASAEHNARARTWPSSPRVYSEPPLSPDHPQQLLSQQRQQPSHSPSHSRSSSRRRLGGITLATMLAAAAVFTPLAAAGPLPTRTVTSLDSTDTVPTPPPVPLTRRRLEVDPGYLNPTTLPSMPITSLPETVLPYYLTRADDGLWYNVQNAWWLYHRVVSEDTPTATASVSKTAVESASSTQIPMGSYAVISVLPRGWGVENKRNAFYKTPLIITASVILAIIIVAAIIFLALQRRKIARRKKRHAARMRRKALAAAGLTEDDVRNSDEDAQAKFKERLDELERQYDVRRRSKSKVHHPSAFVRTKVRVWHKGMRKRKNAGATQNADGEKPTESFTTAHVLGGRQSPASSFTASRTSVASSARSSPDGTNPRVTRRGSSTGSPESGHTPETTLVNTNSDAPLSPTASNSRPASSSQPPSTAEPSPQTSPVSGSAEPQYPNLPPAYRPASIHGNGEGSSSSQTPGMRNVAAAAEKVAASGFYPAPATAEAEQAQRIAHRGESKASIIVPPEEEEERERHHVATDDKRQLERLRMGGSAPPVSRVEDEAGPSAPHFEVDDSGFELFPAEGQGQGSSSLTVPRSSPLPSPSLLPAPPSPARLTSLNTFGSFRSADGLLRSVSHGSARDRSLDSAPLSPSVPPMDLDTPSAPPVASSPMLPSAPPPEDEDEGEGETTHVLSAPSAPSAPPLDDLDDGSEYEHEHELECAHESPSAPPAEDEPADDESPDAEAGSRPSSSAGDMHANLGVRGHRFLPRYEP